MRRFFSVLVVVGALPACVALKTAPEAEDQSSPITRTSSNDNVDAGTLVRDGVVNNDGGAPGLQRVAQAVHECRSNADLQNFGYSPGACPSGYSDTGISFFGTTKPEAGVSKQGFLCELHDTAGFPAAFQGHFFVTLTSTCEGHGTAAGDNGRFACAFDRPLCGARLWSRYFNATGAMRISPEPLGGYTLEGPLGYFFDTALAIESCTER